MKMKNNIFAIEAAPAAIPPNPNIAAIMATTKKISAQRNISNSFGDVSMDTNIIPERNVSPQRLSIYNRCFPSVVPRIHLPGKIPQVHYQLVYTMLVGRVCTRDM